MTDWLLIETFGGGKEPTVLAVGTTVKKMVRLDRILRRERDVTDVLALVKRVVTSREPMQTRSSDGHRLLLGEPLRSYDGRSEDYDSKIYDGRVQGVWVWLGPRDQTLPAHHMAGAWTVNLTRGVSARSEDLFDLYRAAPEERKSVHSLAELFAWKRLRPGSDEASAIAKMVEARPGDEHHAVWTTVGDDGQARAVRYSKRALAEENEAGDIEIVERGITWEIGPIDPSPTVATPQEMLLAARVVAAARIPGQWRGIWDLQHNWLIKWIDDPAPRLVWQFNEDYDRELHPDDRYAYARMQRDLARNGGTTGLLRFRAMDGGWVRFHVDARLMLLNEYTTGALVTLTLSVVPSETLSGSSPES
jgi:hypothetical protein